MTPEAAQAPIAETLITEKGLVLIRTSVHVRFPSQDAWGVG